VRLDELVEQINGILASMERRHNALEVRIESLEKTLAIPKQKKKVKKDLTNV